MAGDRKKIVSKPTVWGTFAVPLVCCVVVLLSLIVGGSMHPADNAMNYFQIAIRSATDIITRKPLEQTASAPAKP
jgi:hypothetical protein